MRSCNHKNIIKLEEVFEDEEYYYMLMELADKGNLFGYLKSKGQLTEKESKNFMKDILEAIYYLHSQNPPIIHRDIKPENILIDSSGRVKLGDFGWSNKQIGLRNTFCGTLDYLSPEMILGTGHN